VGLDVARRFFPPATLRRFIDLAAHFRLNVVHLHLSDNEAWRLPSRLYPRLPSPEHYTERQIRELVEYARRRGVAIVPEIDVPAHAAAAIRAYPALECGTPDTLCAGRAAAFAGRVVTEAAALFDSPYVHTGGDEVDAWTSKERGIFEHALDAALSRAHKTMIVWDDEADAAPADTIVEVWHLDDTARDAMRRGHRVIIASDGPLYFDAVQGAFDQEPPGTRYMATLEEVHAFSAPRGTLGVEAMLWSEHITNEDDLWYALLPREIALGAIAQGAQNQPPWRVFRDSVLPRELRWLIAHHYPFRVPNTMIDVIDAPARYVSVAGNPDASIALTQRRSVRVELTSVLPNARIRYRINGGGAWMRYTAPFAADATRITRIDAQTLTPGGGGGSVSTLFVKLSERPRGSLRFDDIVSP
jgi:hexosaminidase